MTLAQNSLAVRVSGIDSALHSDASGGKRTIPTERVLVDVLTSAFQVTYPCNILNKPLPADPGLQACGIQTTGNGDSVEVDVRDVSELALALSE